MKIRRGFWALVTATMTIGASSAFAGTGRGAKLAESLAGRGWSDDLSVAAIAALPVVELRGAVPVGILYFKMPWWRALAVSVAGNLAPIPVLLLLLEPLARIARKSRRGERLVEWLFARARRKTADIQKYERLGLAIFVAIPLPATGAWTGAIAAVLLGMNPCTSFGAIALGVLGAGTIVTVLTLLGWIGAAVATTALLGLAAAAARRRGRSAPHERLRGLKADASS